MPRKILLNKKEIHFSNKDLPMLIAYRLEEGGSQFTISAIADLFVRGNKILFFTAFPMAKDALLELVAEKKNDVLYIGNSKELQGAEKFGAIIIESGNEQLFLEATKKLSDLNERVVLIKNIETVSSQVLHQALSLENVIISGNVDASLEKGAIAQRQFSATIAFSQPEIDLPFAVPRLSKYEAYLMGEKQKGIITTQRS